MFSICLRNTCIKRLWLLNHLNLEHLSFHGLIWFWEFGFPPKCIFVSLHLNHNTLSQIWMNHLEGFPSDNNENTGRSQSQEWTFFGILIVECCFKLPSFSSRDLTTRSRKQGWMSGGHPILHHPILTEPFVGMPLRTSYRSAVTNYR